MWFWVNTYVKWRFSDAVRWCRRSLDQPCRCMNLEGSTRLPGTMKLVCCACVCIVDIGNPGSVEGQSSGASCTRAFINDVVAGLQAELNTT